MDFQTFIEKWIAARALADRQRLERSFLDSETSTADLFDRTLDELEKKTPAERFQAAGRVQEEANRHATNLSNLEALLGNAWPGRWASLTFASSRDAIARRFSAAADRAGSLAPSREDLLREAEANRVATPGHPEGSPPAPPEGQAASSGVSGIVPGVLEIPILSDLARAIARALVRFFPTLPDDLRMLLAWLALGAGGYLALSHRR